MAENRDRAEVTKRPVGENPETVEGNDARAEVDRRPAGEEPKEDPGNRATGEPKVEDA